MGPLSRNGITPSETDIKNALAELVKEGFLTEEADGTYSITYTGIQQRIKIIQKKP
jgi:predicted transcriptional regulator